MDLSKLDQNEKLAAYGAIAAIAGTVLASISFGVVGVAWLTLILALAMLAIVFLPQLSPQSGLPGSKGTLMLIVGGIAALSALLALLGSIGFLGSNIIFVVGWLLGIVGGLVMGWAGWQEFQAEGGRFQLGAPATGGTRADRDVAPPPTTDASRTDAELTDDEERRTGV